MGIVDDFLVETIDFMLVRSDRGETAGRGPLLTGRERRPRRERQANPGLGGTGSRGVAGLPFGRADYDLLAYAGDFAMRHDPMTWPRVLVSMADSDEASEVLQFTQDWLGHSLPGSVSSRSLGVLELGIPPDLEFAEMVAQMSGVFSVHAAETPVELIWPTETHATLMDAARSLVGLPEDVSVDTSQTVRLCIVDSGLDLSHPDFSVLPEDAVKNFTRESDVRDGLGHGTHVASIAAGTGRASGGKYAGIAPGVDLLVGKVFEADGYASLAFILDALTWAHEVDVDVINLTLGSRRENDGQSMLTRACQRVSELGHVVCAAAGNKGPLPGTVSSPADAPNVIAVGAVDKQFALAEFSSRGSSNPGHHLFNKPNCVAPGVMITAARSAVRDGQYDRPYVSMSGTGMATPVVAGSAAYLISHALRDSSREDARERTKTGLLSTASKQLLDGNNDELYEVGQGLIDIGASLDAIL